MGKKFKKKLNYCRECILDKPDIVNKGKMIKGKKVKLPSKSILFGGVKVYQCPECRALNRPYYCVEVLHKDKHQGNYWEKHWFLTTVKRDKFIEECKRSKLKTNIPSELAMV